MKSVRHTTVLGLAVGEHSVLAAEVVGGERPTVRRIAEMEYPPGVTPLDVEAFGAALGKFRREKGFTARLAVVGLPAKWVIVKAKEVPQTDAATLAELLRTGAEAEFSSELKDLVYDFIESDDGGAGKSVLLMATPRKYVEAATAVCDAAKLSAAAVTSSALVLGAATGKAAGPNALVLTVSAGGAELTAQRNGAASVIRHLRGPEQQAAFVSAVRRAVSTLPPSAATREIVLWDQTGLDARSLGEQLGVGVRAGALPALGVTASLPGVNGESNRYGPAVALAMSILDDAAPPIDFLHSRLAPPRPKRLPRWAVLAIAAGALMLAVGIAAYVDLRMEESQWQANQAKLTAMADDLANAKAFVDKVSFAKGWHADDPRYLMCLRDLTKVVSADDQTYATVLTLRENVREPGAPAVVNGVKLPDPGTLSGQLNGKTPNQGGWDGLLDGLRHMSSSFTDVKLGGTSNADRTHEITFSITFTYIGKTTKH